MMKLTRVLIGVLAAALIATAAPTCVGPSDVLAPGFACSLAGLTFSNFSAQPASVPIFTPVVALVSAQVVGSVAYLHFNPNLTSGQDLWFYYQVSPGALGVDLANGGAPQDSILERVCTAPYGPPHGNTCPGNEVAVLVMSGGQWGEVLFSGPQPRLYVFKDLLAGSGGHITSFTQSWHVPEPMTLSLIGVGLVALGLLRRRRK